MRTAVLDRIKRNSDGVLEFKATPDEFLTLSQHGYEDPYVAYDGEPWFSYKGMIVYCEEHGELQRLQENMARADLLSVLWKY